MAKKNQAVKAKAKPARKGVAKLSKPGAKPSPKVAPKPAKKAVAKPASKKPASKGSMTKKPAVTKPAVTKPAATKPAAMKQSLAKATPPAKEHKPEIKKPEVKKPEVKPAGKVPVVKAAGVKTTDKASIKPVAKPVVKSVAKPEPVAILPPDDKAAAARKGITVVPPKPMKKPKPKAPSTDISALAGSLLSSGVARKPLISSGPSAPALKPLGVQGTEEAVQRVAGKTPFNKKELEHFRSILLRKRAELLGDVSHLEEEALRGESGALSNMPQHMAEQGSETYEQSLHLDLAAAGSKLIKEIDDALKRIELGTFGVCELTGKPIRVERLEELPWARHSIEAARELERRSMRT